MNKMVLNMGFATVIGVLGDLIESLLGFGSFSIRECVVDSLLVLIAIWIIWKIKYK